MKKLLAASCAVLAFQTVSQVAPESVVAGQVAGRRAVLKAVAVIVNAEAQRKVPPKRICPAATEGAV